MLKKIFRRDHIVVIVLIAGAVLTLFEIPQKLNIGETKVVLLMLGFLALNSLLEKLGYFERIETSITNIEHIITPHPNVVTLQNRAELALFSECVSSVKNVFVFAISARSLVYEHVNAIEQALRDNETNFSFLISSPDNPALSSAFESSASEAELNDQIDWINQTTEQLKKLARRTSNAKGRIELAYFQGLPTMSLIAYDISLHTGSIQVEQHVYKKTPSERPVYVLKASRKSEWYDFYHSVTKLLWERAEKVSIL